MQSGFTQFKELGTRELRRLARDVSLLRTALGVTMCTAVLLGLFFYQLDNRIPGEFQVVLCHLPRRRTTQKPIHTSDPCTGTQNRAGVLFFLVIWFSLTSMSVLGLFLDDRERFVNEHLSGYYSFAPYYCARVFSDLLSLRLLPPCLFTLLCYFTIGLQVVRGATQQPP